MIRPVLCTFLALILLQNISGKDDLVSIRHRHEPIQTFSTDNRLIGGRPARPGEFPHQLQIRYLEAGHICGATLIFVPGTRRQAAITAGHCVTFPNTTDVIPKERFQLRAGTTGVNQTNGQTLTIKNIIVHPEYMPLNEYGSRNDIAMLIIDGKFTLNRFVRPLALPRQFMQTTGSVIVSGWGVTNSSNLKEPASVLQAVVLPMINESLCRSWYKEESGENMIYPTNFCAGFEQGGINTCSGDSGGPAVGVVGGKRYLAGVVSWGSRVCDAPRNPGVFTRVSYYVNWIRQVSSRCDVPENN